MKSIFDISTEKYDAWQGHPFYSSTRFYSFEDIEGILQDAGLNITRIRSTLFQRPEEPRRIENPVEEYKRRQDSSVLK
jgi:hypothetical protein